MLHPKVTGQQFRGTSLATSARLFQLTPLGYRFPLGVKQQNCGWSIQFIFLQNTYRTTVVASERGEAFTKIIAIILCIMAIRNRFNNSRS